MLSQEQIDFFHTQGYLGVDDLLSPAEVAALQQVTDDFIGQSRQFTVSNDVFDLEPDHTPDVPRVRRLINPAAQHPIYDQVRCHNLILEILSHLIGPNIRYSGNKLNMKTAKTGSAVEWHQDWAFHPHTNDDYLTVGIAIDEMTQDNGALLVIPGSHRGPIYDHHQDGVFVGAVTNPIFDQSKAIPIEVKAGGISIHHVRTLHASAPNRSKRPRRLLLIDYCATDAWPLMWTPTWDAFKAAILRGKPLQEPRLEAVPVRLPLPSVDPTAVIFELQNHLITPILGKKLN